MITSKRHNRCLQRDDLLVEAWLRHKATTPRAEERGTRRALSPYKILSNISEWLPVEMGGREWGMERKCNKYIHKTRLVVYHPMIK